LLSFSKIRLLELEDDGGLRRNFKRIGKWERVAGDDVAGLPCIAEGLGIMAPVLDGARIVGIVHDGQYGRRALETADIDV